MSAGDLVSGEIKPNYEVHEGLDYVVVLAPDDTTDNATARFRDADTARKFVRACNAHDDLVKALQDSYAAAHAVLIAGGDYGDDLSDLDLRYLLKTSQATICAALAKAGVK